MNIALMTNNYKPFVGGVPISIERLAQGLRALGHSVTVFAPTYDRQETEEDVFRYAALTQRFIGGIVLPNPLDWRIEREFKRRSFDLIHVHHPVLIGRTAAYLSKKYDIPLVFTYHTRYEQYLSYGKGVAALERMARGEGKRAARLSGDCLHLLKEKLLPAYLRTFLKSCDFVFAPTAGMERYLNQVLRIPKDRVGVLPTGLSGEQFEADEEKKRALREKYGAVGKTLFLTVSRMSHEKNVAFLLESLALARGLTGKEFKMLLVGDGPELPRYRQLAQKLGLEDMAEFIGGVENHEIAAYFAAADAFLFASQTETQGIVVLEAFAGGTPVLALEASGVSDLVRHGCNGLLCGQEKQAYAGMLRDFVEGAYDAGQLSQNALETALCYREEIIATQALHTYNRIVQSRHQAAEGQKEPGRGQRTPAL